MMNRDESKSEPAPADSTAVETIFNAALERPVEERGAFLREECQGNQVLLSRLERLLAAFLESGDLLEELPIHALGADEPEPSAMLPGQRIGPYELIRVLATGGMGTVWLARRADEQFDKQVALKLIKHGMDTEALLARFRNERQVLASLEHACIARLLDAGITPDGLPYLVMEYVDGLPIDQYCDQNRLSVPQRLELFRTILGGVQYAHQNLVVHRDLKPSNILVAENGAPKIVDFGIAKVLHPDGSAALNDITAPQFRIMTPRYASPEQVRGEKITTASDIYSMGVVLFELLTGHEPYDLTTRSQAEYERAICDQEPQRPSTAVSRTRPGTDSSSACSTVTPQAISAARSEDPRRLRRRLSGDLDMIVLKALRKDPVRRYATAEQFSEDIHRHIEHLPILARPDSWMYRTRKLAARNRGAVAAAAIIGVALLAATGVSISFGRSESKQRQIAEENQRKAERAELQVKQERDSAAGERDKAVAVTDLLVRVLQSQDPRELGRQDMLVSDAMRQAMKILDRGDLSSQPETAAALLDAVARILDHAGKSAEALPMAERALEMRHRIHPGDHTAVASSLNNLALCLQNVGRMDEALGKFQAALEMRQRLFGADNAAVALNLANLAGCLQLMGRTADALPKFEAALAMRQRLYPGDNEEVALGQRQLACCLLFDGRAAEALPHFQASLSTYQRLFGANNGQVAIGMRMLGRCIRDDGRPAEGLKAINDALEISRRLYKEDDPAIALGLADLATSLQAMGQSSEALSKFQECLRIYQQAFKGDHQETARTLGNIAGCLLALGQSREALTNGQASLEMCQSLFKSDHPDLANALNVMGRCLAAAGRSEDALARYDDALSMYRRLYLHDHPLIANCLTDMGLCLNGMGHTREALANYEEALAMQQRIYCGENPFIANSLCNVAVCLQGLKRPAEALPKIESALEMRKRLLPEGHVDIEVAQAFMGVVLVDLNRLDEAEPLLLTAMDALDHDKSVRPARKKRGIDALVKLYEARQSIAPNPEYAAKAREWRAKLVAH